MTVFVLLVHLFNAANQPIWTLQRTAEVFPTYEQCAAEAVHRVDDWQARTGVKAAWECRQATQPAPQPDQPTK
jgi:hypothetical protein